MKYYNLDGSDFIDDGHAVPPIGLQFDECKDYMPGWYFFDECQQPHGPFSTFEETVELFRKYGEELNG